MRADAVQRKLRIMAEARRLFAERDSAISLDTIAEASGVGIATLYRNFASRDELIVAVSLDILGDIDEALEASRVDESQTGQQVWARLVHRLVGLNLGAMTDALGATNGWQSPAEVTTAQGAVLARFDAVLGELARRGAVRKELTAIEAVVAIGIITRPQPEVIRRATPHLVNHLIEAFLVWSRPVK